MSYSFDERNPVGRAVVQFRWQESKRDLVSIVSICIIVIMAGVLSFIQLTGFPKDLVSATNLLNVGAWLFYLSVCYYFSTLSTVGEWGIKQSPE